MLPVLLFLGQGIFGVLQSWAAHCIILAGLSPLLLTACVERRAEN